MLRFLCAATTLTLGVACAPAANAEPPREAQAQCQTCRTGIASWYGPRHHGRRTANGERFDRNALTAAHNTLPLNSRVRVVNPRNGRAVVVRINDRGPGYGRMIDLSEAAARQLAIIDRGIARVRLEPIPDNLAFAR